MNKIICIVIVWTIVAGCRAPEVASADPVRQGFLDLGNLPLKADFSMPLKGEWEFHWKCFLPPSPRSAPLPERSSCPGEADGPAYYPFPATWNDSPRLTPAGFASYRLRLRSPEAISMGLRISETYSAYELYLNGQLISSNGKPGMTAETETPFWLVQTVFVNLPAGENEFILHVSSHNHRKGGTWNPITIGRSAVILSQREEVSGTELILMALLVMMGIYHAGLYYLRRAEKTSLLFGLFSFSTVVRIAFTGERLIYWVFPFLTYRVLLRMEYISMYIGTPLFVSFFYSTFPALRFVWFERAFWIVSLVAVLVTIAFPPVYYTYLAIPYQVMIGIMSLVILYGLIVGLRKKVPDLPVAIVGFIPLVFATAVTVLYADDVHLAVFLPPHLQFPVGLIFFIFTQSYLLASRFTRAYQGVEDLTQDLAATSRSYSRFVPVEFLSLLEKKNIKDVRPGDQRRMDVTILFLDIRNFTGLSETMTPEENFAFINAFIRRVSPAIHENAGFIDKFIGDGIMAIFPGSADDALKAAIGMQDLLNHYNESRRSQNLQEIRVGIGIHTGSMILGIVGTDQRMDGSVISDAVNVGSRVESLTRYFNSPVLFTLDTYNALKNPELFRCRIIGRVRVKGKQKTVSVVELLDPIPAPERFLDTRASFEGALSFLHNGRIADAERNFRMVLEMVPDDRAAKMYLDLCEEIVRNPDKPIDLNLRPE